jgi:predicted lipoprotein with Yx(FWY)xxD motif
MEATMGIPVMRRTLRPARLAAVTGGALGAALLAAACSSGSSSAGPAGTGSAGTGSTAAVISTASASGVTFLTDGGRAVYLWDKDTGGMSACSGACAGAWPPVSGTVTAAGGAQASQLGTITRSDGTKQVTYAGHPLYFFVGDSGTGTANGQGSPNFGAKWWLVAPSGAAVTAAVSSFTVSGSSSAPSAPASSPYGGGYR